MICKWYVRYTYFMNLSSQKCTPCEVGGVPLNKDEVTFYAKDAPEWSVSSDLKKISRMWKFEDFKEAISFTNKIAVLAEEEGHHPDISIHYSEVTIELWTHAVGGLSVNDFIMAAKIENLSR
jgi:4a-hydroxytetrahydrobiopterin dehydratase